MKRLLFLVFIATSITGFAQEQDPLPSFTVKNLNNRIVVSWINDYKLPVTTLSIQRSYDSLKNFTTIGSVLGPQNRENGYSDMNFPYNKMYYRIFVAFQGGSYVITPSARPVKDSLSAGSGITERYPWMRDPNMVDTGAFKILTGASLTLTKESHVIIHLPDYLQNRYAVKFFDDAGNLLFELAKLNDEYLVLEKVHFRRSGRYRYEVYENGKIIINDFLQIQRDLKKTER